MAVLPKPLTSWSYSRYTLYSQCPAKFKYSVLDKLPEPKGDALVRGAHIHTLAETYLKGAVRTLPAELKLFGDDFKRLKAKRKKDPESVIVEDNWAFTNSWGPSRWDDWKNCWLRVKLDVAERTGNQVVITDYKTGKYRPDNITQYEEQGELYVTGALQVFSSIPDLRVSARLVYLDAGKVYPEKPVEYTLDQLPVLKKNWMARVKPMFADKKFAPRPNQFCKWCSFRKDNGGPCKF